MDELPGPACIYALDPKMTAKKRMPTVMHLNELPDMGRMNG